MTHYVENDSLIAEIRIPGIKMERAEIKGGEQGFCVKAGKNRHLFESCFYLGLRVDPTSTKTELARGMLRMQIPLKKEDIRGWTIPLSMLS